MNNPTAPRPPRLEFIAHTMSDEDVQKTERVRLAFSDCLSAVEAELPASRERSLVLTGMQEACMWAIRGIAVVPPPPPPPPPPKAG